MEPFDRLLEDDPEAWAVRADALLEAGDPRGFLAARQTGAPVTHRDLPADQREWIEAHDLLGPMRRPSRYRLTWQHGHWHGFGNWANSQTDRWWEALFAHPCAGFLRRMSMRWIEPQLFLRLLQEHRPPLQYLHWNERDAPVDLDPFFEALPQLTDLRLWRPARLTRGPERPLKGLAVNTGEGNQGLRDDLVALAARGELRELDDLEIWGRESMFGWLPKLLAHVTPGKLQLSGGVPGSVVAGLVSSPAWLHVEHLEFLGFWPDDAAAEALVSAIERRDPPLRVYRSTGRELDDGLVRRMEAVVEEVSVRG